MAGPLSGIGQGTTIPLSNTFQPGQNNTASSQVRSSTESEQQTQTNRVQPPNAQASATQNTETGNQDVLKAQQEQTISPGVESSEPRERGSLIDITV